MLVASISQSFFLLILSLGRQIEAARAVPDFLDSIVKRPRLKSDSGLEHKIDQKRAREPKVPSETLPEAFFLDVSSRVVRSRRLD